MDKVLAIFTNAGFSIAAICVCLCMLFSYFLKSRKDKMELKSKYFILDLSSIIIVSIIEIIYVVYYVDVGTSGKLAVFLYQLYFVILLFVTFFSWAFVITYRISISNNSEKLSKIKFVFYLIILFIQVIIAVLIFTSPVKIYTNYGLYTFDSTAITVTLFYVFFSTSLFVLLLYFRNSSITRKDLYPAAASLVVVVLLLAQRLITGLDINIETFQFTIFALGIFFTIENQDYFLIEMAQQKQDAAQNATESQKEFLENISHQIRTPMNTIMGLDQLLLIEDDFSKEKILEDVKSINESSKALVSLINNINDYSYLVSSNEELDEQEYNLNEFLIVLSDSIKAKITNDDLKFEFIMGGDLPKTVIGDSQKLSKILLNVTGNIIRNADSGIIFLTVNCISKENDFCILEFIVNTTGIHTNKEIISTATEDTKDISVEELMNSDALGSMVVKNLVDVLNANLRLTGEDGKNGYVLSLKQKLVNENTKNKVEEKVETPKEEQEGGVSNA